MVYPYTYIIGRSNSEMSNYIPQPSIFVPKIVTSLQKECPEKDVEIRLTPQVAIRRGNELNYKHVSVFLSCSVQLVDFTIS